MIRQLGPTTFSMTFISAESKWTTLMSTLHMLNKNHMEIMKFFYELESKHFTDLVKSDPNTCACYYNHRMAAFHNLLKKDSSIFGKVDDFHFVTKFQNRGNEHYHGLLWIKNGPTYGANSNETIEQFVYKYVTSNNSLLPLHLKDSQKHKHEQTSRKKNQVVCRFHYPLPPMPCTKILEPLKETLSSSQNKNCRTLQIGFLKT